MNKLKKASQRKKSIHKACRSQADPDFFKSNRKSCLSLMDSPMDLHKQLENDYYRTQDNRRYLIDNRSISFDKRKTSKNSNFVAEKVLQAKEKIKNIKRVGSSIELLKDQDEIIKLQNNLIDNLRKEISIIGKDHTEPQTARENTKRVTIKEVENEDLDYTDSEVVVLPKKFKRKESIIKDLKDEMKLKDEVIQNLKSEMKLKDEKKDELIHKLGTIIENQAKDPELEKYKLFYERENEIKKKLEEDLESLKEENKILIQNYEDFKKNLVEYETVFNSIKALLSKISDSKCTLHNISSIIEHILNQNTNFSEKNKFFAEKVFSMEKENNDLKAKYSKSKTKISSFKDQLKNTGNSDLLNEKLRKKSVELEEIKKLLNSQEKNNLKRSASINHTSKEYLVLESQMYVMEEEINLLKTEKRILINKEIDLSAKLKTSEKARYYYQEQAIRLKDKLNSLELQLNHIDCISQDQKSKIELSNYEGKRTKSNRITKLVNLL